MILLEQLHKIPFLRFLLPFAIGIASGNYLFFEYGSAGNILSFTYILPLVLVLLIASYFLKKYSLRWVFGFCTGLFFFLSGFVCIHYQLNRAVYSFPEEETVYRAVITQKPEYKERSLLCRVRISEKNVLLYFPPDSASATLKSGDEILISARVSLPKRNGNPEEFDYPTYLIHNNISGTAYVPAANWRTVAANSYNSLRKKALDCRDGIVEQYRKLGFYGDNLSVLSALTVGYKEELSESIKETFSVSGASHVLALSGLHVGFIYALLFFLLKRIPGSSKGVLLFRAGIIIVLLWGFAFIAGLSASIVRSVIMFSLFALSALHTGRVFSLNSLCAAGLAMLIYNPCWLFDVGFQLSFSAVAAILLIQPWLYRKVPVSNKLLKYIWGLITVSVAAQIGTAPLVLLYFSRFPTHFLLTNLLVIPLVSLIMYLAVIMLLFTPVPLLQHLLARVEMFLLDMLNGATRWVELLPYASINNVWLYRPEVIMFYVLIMLLTAYMACRKYNYLATFLVGCCLIIGYRTWATYEDRPRQSIAFYNVRNCPAVHCIASTGDSWLAYADSVPEKKRLARSLSDYWNKLRLPEPVPVTSDYKDECFLRKDNMLLFSGKRLYMLNDDGWWNSRSDNLLHIDYLYICNGYKGTIDSLTNAFMIKCVVIDTSLPGYRREKLSEECGRLGIECISITEGASIVYC